MPQAEQEKEQNEQRMYALIRSTKEKTGNAFIAPKWFQKVQNADQIKPGEGIRWRYGGKYWAARKNGFADYDLSEGFAGITI